MIIIALGSNKSGPWGNPKQTLERALSELTNRGIHVIALSGAYHTKPHGFSSIHNFVNATAVAATPLPALALLKVLKQIEAEAGRTVSRNWTSRTLDLDIIDYRKVICNWKMRKPCYERRVVLPHPRAHMRAFVMLPLLEVLPFWHHPVFGLTPAEFLLKPGVVNRGEILSREDLTWRGDCKAATHNPL